MLKNKKIEWNSVEEKYPEFGEIVIAYDQEKNKSYVSKFFKGVSIPVFCDLSSFLYYENPSLKFNGYNIISNISLWVYAKDILDFLIPE